MLKKINKQLDDFVTWQCGGSLRFVGANKTQYTSAPMRQEFVDMLNKEQEALRDEILEAKRKNSGDTS